MRQGLKGLFRSRITRTVLLVVVGLALIGAAYGFKTNYRPGPVSAMQLRGEPLQGYSSHADFERECLHCHAPVRCLSANLCQDCHMEIARERAGSEGLHGLLPGTEKCQTCHSEHQGREVMLSEVSFGSVNHEGMAGFCLDLHRVDYAGDPLTCQSCHRLGQYGAASEGCLGCHAAEAPEAMGGHVEAYGEGCVGCHDGQDRMMGFAHDDVYVLDGGHEGIDCVDCHPGLVFGEEEERACVACHEDPEVHAGEFGLECDRCHTAVGWLPAQLTRHLFRLDHGEGGEVACETCHVGSYVVYTCYGCHDHQLAEMKDFHAEEGIYELEPCGECHPTGRAGEAGELRDGA